MDRRTRGFRRGLLRGVASGLPLGLAGCASDGGESRDQSPDGSTEATESVTPSPTESESLPERVSAYQDLPESKAHLDHYFDKRLEIARNLDDAIEADRNTELDGAVGAFIEGDVRVQREQRRQYAENLDRELRIANRNLDREREGYETIDVTDHGAVGDGETNDRPAFDAAVEAARDADRDVRIVVPSGEYALHEEWHLDGLEHTLVEGAPDATLLGIDMGFATPGDAGLGRLLFLTDCLNVRFRDLAFDLDPLPFTQGTVDGVNPKKRTIEFTLGKKSDGTPFRPPTDRTFETARLPRVLIKEPGSTTLAPGVSEDLLVDSEHIVDRLDPVEDLESFGVEHVTGDTYELTVNINGGLDGVPSQLRQIETGQSLVLIAREAGRHPIGLKGNEFTTFRGVSVHAAFSFAFMMHAANTSTKWVDVEITPRDDSVVHSANADGINTRTPGVGPFIHDTRIEATGDDCLNVHTELFRVDDLEVGGPREVRIDERWIRHAKSFEPGDVLAFVRDGPPEIVGFATIERSSFADVDDSRPPIDLRCESAIPAGVSEGDMVLNTARLGGGFVVSNTDFLHNRASGAKLLAPDGVLEDLRISKDVFLWSSLDSQRGWPVRTITASNVNDGSTELYRIHGDSEETRLFRRLPVDTSG
jgi:hypothetical protein